jgi:hypothetical protein
MIAGYLFRHILYDIQIESYVLGMKVRLLGDIFAIAVFMFWIATRRKTGGVEYGSWIFLHPLLIELVILFGTMTIALEVEDITLPVIWAVAAIVLLFIGKTGPELSRLRFYGLLFGWASTIQLAAVTSTVETASSAFLMQPVVVGVIVIALNILFLILINSDNFLRDLKFPRALSGLPRLTDGINRHKHLWVYYPFFFATALFLYWRFDAAILTLLLVAECFVIFALSIILRVPHFKTLSMAALGACLARLIGWDLSRTGTLMRGVVFVGVGGIMLAMNYLYKRYKVKFAE